MARQPLRSFFVLLLFGVALLTLALVVRSGMFEVKTHDEPINASMRAALAEEEPELSTQDSLYIDEAYQNAAVTKSGLRFLVRQFGSGPKPAPGDEVKVFYAARLLDGTQVDSTYQTGVPFRFRLGSHEVPPAFNEAFADMRKGEKRTLIVPYWLGYPPGHRPKGVGPKSTLIFEVELLSFSPP